MCNLCDNLKEKSKLEHQLSELKFYRKMAKEGVYFTTEQFLKLKKSIRRDAVIKAVNICYHCGTDGEAWQSELEQVAIKMEKGEL